ncbi:MAG: CopG family transcriptional regulator [Planctomycetales bacterium]
MVSLTIQIDDNVAEALREMARERNRSEADLIRDAIANYARSPAKVPPKGIGQYHSGRSDVAENARAILRQAVEDGQWP